MNNVDHFINECKAIITLFRAGHLAAEYLEVRFNLAAQNHCVS